MFTDSQQYVYLLKLNEDVNFMLMNTDKKTPTERIFDELFEEGISDAEFARQMDTSKQNVLNWKKRGIPAEHIFHAAHIINRSPEWIKTGEELIRIDKKHIEESSFLKESNYSYKNDDIQLLRVPLISWVQAGHWAEIIDNFEPGSGEEWIPTVAKIGPHSYALKVNGDSMEPEFPNGSIIIVDPDLPIETNSYVIVRLEQSNEATFKQYIEEGNIKLLKPVNPRYPILEIKEPATFCGKVIMYQKDVNN